MRVEIPIASLQKHGACSAYLESPEWDKEKQALIYNDWSETVERLFSTKWGTSYLDWLVSKKLVPMSHREFQEEKSARRPAMRIKGRPPVEPEPEESVQNKPILPPPPPQSINEVEEFQRVRAQTRVLGRPAVERAMAPSPQKADPTAAEIIKRALPHRILGRT